MARTARIKAARDLDYHLTSRIAGREFKLSDPEAKSALARILRKAAAFSGVSVRAWCVMDNHFHVVCRVFGSRRGQTPENVVLERISALKGPEAADLVRSHLAELRRYGLDNIAEQVLARWRRRMEDVSEFVKTVKESFNVWYKRRHEYSGGIWEGRFKSTCVQDGAYLRRCIVYVECNPIRAGLVSRRGEYVWSSSPSDRLPGRGSTRLSDRGSDLDSPTQTGVSRGLSPTEGEGQDEMEMTEEDRRFSARRRAQVANGKLLGDLGFVSAGIGEFAAHFHGCGVRPRAVVGADGYSSHGHRLAALDAAKEVAA